MNKASKNKKKKELKNLRKLKMQVAKFVQIFNKLKCSC